MYSIGGISSIIRGDGVLAIAEKLSAGPAAAGPEAGIGPVLEELEGAGQEAEAPAE